MQNRTARPSLREQIDLRILVPGCLCLLALMAVGAVIPEQFDRWLNTAIRWVMAHFKWVYVVCVLLVTAACIYSILGKWGDIRLGGKNAKPSLKTGTWFALTLTGTIAVGICFYGVSGPVNIFTHSSR